MVTPALALADGLVRDLFPEQAWSFEVFLDRKPIGFHTFRVQETDSGQRVEIEADFNVKVLFIKAFSYEHRNVETWAAGCLEGVASSTRVNGDPQSLEATDAGDTFLVRTKNQESRLDRDCVKSFAYWQPSILEAESLLNSQTGELTDVKVRRAGDEVLDIDGRDIPATRWVLTVPEGDITLWYGRDTGLWLGLEAPARGGRTLRYRPVSLPQPPQESPRFGLN